LSYEVRSQESGVRIKQAILSPEFRLLSSEFFNSSSHPQVIIQHRRGEQHAVHPVEHPAVSGNKAPRILHADTSLEKRLHKITERARSREDKTEDRGLQNTDSGKEPGAAQERGAGGGDPPIRPSTLFLGLIFG